MNTTRNIENDYSGVEALAQFHDILINLPDDLIEEIEKLAEQNPKYGVNGVCAILLWKGIDCLNSGQPLV